MVDKDSAIIDGSQQIGFDTDHRSLKNFPSRDDERYQDVLKWLHEWAKQDTADESKQGAVAPQGQSLTSRILSLIQSIGNGNPLIFLCNYQHDYDAGNVVD